MAAKKKTDEESELSSASLIQAVGCLDPSEQDQFEPLVQNCLKQLESKHAEELARFKHKEKEKHQAESNSKTEMETPQTEEKSEDKQSDEAPKVDDKKQRPQVDLAMQPIPPAQQRKEAEDRQPRAKGRSRKQTPDCFKVLLPNIDSLYLLWSPENRMVSVDFQGRFS